MEKWIGLEAAPGSKGSANAHEELACRPRVPVAGFQDGLSSTSAISRADPPRPGARLRPEQL